MKTYRKYKMLPSCWLSKADLTRLVHMATEQTAQVTISTRIGDTIVEASTLETFLVQADLLPVLDNLRIWGSTEKRHITIELGKLHSAIEISAENAEWMRVHYERLHDFLQQRRQVEPPGRGVATIAVSITMVALLTHIAILMVQQQVLYGCVAIVTGAFVMLRYSRWAFLKRDRSTGIVVVDTAARWRARLTRDNVIMAIAVLGLLFTVLQMLT